MKLAVLFVLLVLAFDKTESKNVTKEKVVCVKKDEVN